MLVLNHFSEFSKTYTQEKNRRHKLRENDPSKNMNYLGKKAQREKTIRKRARRAEQIKQKIQQIEKASMKETQIKHVKNSKIKLKGISKAETEAFINFIERYANLSDLLYNLPIEAFYEMFFNLGINKNLLHKNIKTLLDTVQSITEKTGNYPQKKIYLVHVMMPLYFNNSKSYFEQGLLNNNLIELFLIKLAEFYKELYKELCESQNIENNLKIIIVIPPIRYFENYILKQEISSHISHEIRHRKQEKNTATLIKNEIIDKLSKSNTYVLANAHITGMNAIAQFLIKKDPCLTERILTVQIPLYDSTGRTPKGFTPYILNMRKKYDFKQSPVINSNLFDYIESKFINRMNQNND